MRKKFRGLARPSNEMGGNGTQGQKLSLRGKEQSASSKGQKRRRERGTEETIPNLKKDRPGSALERTEMANSNEKEKRPRRPKVIRKEKPKQEQRLKKTSERQK